MIHMILVILKIIGWILLAAAGIILAVLLTVLLVPVRYRAEGEFYGQLSARGRISWLFGIVAVNISYENGESSLKLRIAGIPVGEEKEESGWEEEQETERELEPEIHTASLDHTDSPDLETDGDSRTDGGGPRQAPRKSRKEPRRREARRTGRKTLSGILQKLETAGKKIKKRLRRSRRKIMELLSRKNQLMELIRDEENRKTFRLTKKQIGRIFHHIRPGKIQGKVRFGFDDPYRTGQALSAAALLCPIYKNSLQITPVFDRSVLEGELKFRGRIRLGTVAAAGIRLLMDRNFRRLAGKLMNR